MTITESNLTESIAVYIANNMGIFTFPMDIQSSRVVQLIAVVFMILSQAGFGMLYSGLSRAKNALTPNITIIINMFIVLAGTWGVGYTFAYSSGNEFIGYKMKWFGAELNTLDYMPWVLHACYTMMVVNIGCGGVIERGKPFAYFVIAVTMSFFIYPVVVHWAWDNEGWLQTIKLKGDNLVTFRDTGGSCIIHVCGGIVAIVSSVTSGRRQERVVTEKCCRKTIQIMHGHSAPMTSLGGLLIYCGFIALQLSRSVTVSTQVDINLLARVVMNILIGSLGSITIIFLFACLLNYHNKQSTDNLFQWPMINATVNGALVGLVSVAAGCDTYYSYFAFVVGVVGGVVYMIYSFMVYFFLIDDPADAFAVHFGAGFWGLLAVAIFSRKHGAALYGNDSNTPYLFFAWNLIGGIAITSWCFALIVVVLITIWAMGILRIDKFLEKEGVDSDTFGEFAYPIEAWKRPRSNEDQKDTQAVQDDLSHVSVISEKPLVQDTYHYRPDLDSRDRNVESRDNRIVKRPNTTDQDYRDYYVYHPESTHRKDISFDPHRFDPHPWNQCPYHQNWLLAPRARLSHRTTPYGSVRKIGKW